MKVILFTFLFFRCLNQDEVIPKTTGGCGVAFNVTHTQDVLLEITLPRWQMSAPQDIDPASECSLLCEMSWFDSNDIESSSFVRSLKKADYGQPANSCNRRKKRRIIHKSKEIKINKTQMKINRTLWLI